MKGLFMSHNQRGTLQENGSSRPDLAFPVVTLFLYKFMGMSNIPIRTNLQTLFSYFWQKVNVGSRKLSWTNTELKVLNYVIRHFEKILVDTFSIYRSRVAF